MELTNENISLILTIVAWVISFVDVIFIFISRRNSIAITFYISSYISSIFTLGIAAVLLFVAFALTPSYWDLLVIGFVYLVFIIVLCIHFSNMLSTLFEVLFSKTFKHQLDLF